MSKIKKDNSKSKLESKIVVPVSTKKNKLPITPKNAKSVMIVIHNVMQAISSNKLLAFILIIIVVLLIFGLFFFILGAVLVSLPITIPFGVYYIYKENKHKKLVIEWLKK
jgi:hypothetical protein